MKGGSPPSFFFLEQQLCLTLLLFLTLKGEMQLMKDGRAQECVDYIRFTMELEGAGLSDSDEKILSDILTDECSAAEAVASLT